MSPSPTQTRRLPELVRRLLDDHFQEDVELPVLPDTSMEVLALCGEGNCDARLLSERISRDQSLTGHLLRVANSTAYAPKEPIVSLQQAVSRLGHATVQEIAIAVSLNSRVFNAPGWGTKIRKMWMHSAAAGIYAKEVARALRHNVESAFLCGLLHDVGRPIVLQALIDITKKRTSTPIPPGIAESAMDMFHAEVGALVVRRWKLADWLLQAVGEHDKEQGLDDLEYATEIRITQLADLLSDWALDPTSTEEDFPAECDAVQRLNLYADDLMKLLEKRGDVLEVAESFV